MKKLDFCTRRKKLFFGVHWERQEFLRLSGFPKAVQLRIGLHLKRKQAHKTRQLGTVCSSKSCRKDLWPKLTSDGDKIELGEHVNRRPIWKLCNQGALIWLKKSKKHSRVIECTMAGKGRPEPGNHKLGWWSAWSPWWNEKPEQGSIQDGKKRIRLLKEAERERFSEPDTHLGNEGKFHVGELEPNRGTWAISQLRCKAETTLGRKEVLGPGPQHHLVPFQTARGLMLDKATVQTLASEVMVNRRADLHERHPPPSPPSTKV